MSTPATWSREEARRLHSIGHPPRPAEVTLGDIALLDTHRHLRAEEETLRVSARRLELDPACRDDANRLFREADRIRAQRVELIERWLTR